MGVPKFYRWISERYPCLSQVIKENQIPEFDNLYLDMNGIIHICSHPNDDDPHFRITEAQIFSDIFHYIEVLFRIIRPKRNFFMAVDGVAPRAKMNQQRGRRFRTAKEAEDNIRKALQKGETLPSEDRFDSNCITPGTGFMARLHEQLKYFVNKKISTDSQWQCCTVYLSGHNVPGEGEHKVMDFIRYMKSKDDYDPNTRHCLYGLDADLVMLGLTSHEPHFSLLREEVCFGKQAKRQQKPEQTTWHLLHLSLMREYLDFEFQSLKDRLLFPYDLERIIDDWVLLGFLVGNDFVPHLPYMHINKDSLPLLYKTYIEVLPELDGYLHDGGNMNLQRMEVYLNALTKFELDKFEEIYADLKWLEGKHFQLSLDSADNTSTPTKKYTSTSKEQLRNVSNTSNAFFHLADVSDAFDDSLTLTPDKGVSALRKLEISNDDDRTCEDEEMFDLEFKQHRREYYREKFGIEIIDDEFIDCLALEYMRAIQWILHYYFNGVQSWSWYYPYHYAPYITDLKNVGQMDLHFEPGTPFRPFEQLLAVLPAASKKLLPDVFQGLMTLQTSPIIDYYPVNFKTDLNGKQQEWEAVVLIPFIDENRLWSAMQPCYPKLTKEEKERNAFGSCLKYTFSPEQNIFYPSSFPDVFEDIRVCRAKCTTVSKDAFRLDKSKLRKGLCDGLKQDIFFPGFPTFKHIPHMAYRKKCGVKVFKQNSNKDNTIIKIQKRAVEDLDKMADDLIGEVIYVEWPYLVEANVVTILTKYARYVKTAAGDLKKIALSELMINNVESKMNQVQKYHMERRGIETGEIDIIIEAKPLKGKRYLCSNNGEVALEKEWSAEPLPYAYQTIVENLPVYASLYNKVHESIDEFYLVGEECFMMASPHYGCSGEVLTVDKKACRIRVALNVTKEPDLQEIIDSQKSTVTYYVPSEKVARKFGISTRFLSIITSSVLVERAPGRRKQGNMVNLGLKLKFTSSKREVLGYTRFYDNRWSFSSLAIKVIEDYFNKFPEVLDVISKTTSIGHYEEEHLFPNNPDLLDKVSEWLKSLPCYNSNTVKCGTVALEEPAVKAIEEAVTAMKKCQQKKVVTVNVRPFVLFKPMEEFGELVPDPATDYYLFDRVVTIRNNGPVPCGLRGTIIGIHRVGEDDAVGADNQMDLKFEIVFDDSFLGGLSTRGVKGKVYYLTESSLLNLSYGARKEIINKGLSPAKAAAEQGRSPWQTTSRLPQSSPLRSPAKAKSVFRENSPYRTPKFRTEKRISHADQNTSNHSGCDDPTEMFLPQYICSSPGKKHPESIDLEGTAFLHTICKISGQGTAKESPTNPAEFAKTLRPNLPRFPQVTSPIRLCQASPVAPVVSLSTTQNMQRFDVPLPSVMLKGWLANNRLPAPIYSYSQGPQGFLGFVAIGQNLRFNGVGCNTVTDAYESAALEALTNVQAPTSPSSQPVAMHPQLGNVGHFGAGSPVPQMMPANAPAQNTSPMQFYRGENQNAKHTRSRPRPAMNFSPLQHVPMSRTSQPIAMYPQSGNMGQFGIGSPVPQMVPANAPAQNTSPIQFSRGQNQNVSHTSSRPRPAINFIPIQVERVSRSNVKETEVNSSAEADLNQLERKNCGKTALSPTDDLSTVNQVKDLSSPSSIPVGTLIDIVESSTPINSATSQQSSLTSESGKLESEEIGDKPKDADVTTTTSESDGKVPSRLKVGKGKKIHLAPRFLGETK